MNDEYISESDDIIRECAKLEYNEGMEKAYQMGYELGFKIGYKKGKLKTIRYLKDIINKNPDITAEELSQILNQRIKILEKKDNE
ncbi:hypothetical protein [Methanobrevibacter millerae]|uniref:Uncharacterized protein n=1 Tax=Methanobrevibacter millerae TaxID=230361 RepID=A0A1G5XEB2_9EURY|nr:hypothetical protein [Methanobrevibacter millerae]SDA68741.1 hypothetical protein SAMN02910315_02185 [Methanobrevibacter millerae]